MNNLILVRHGQSLWNKERRFTGWADIDLTDQGKLEARYAGELIKKLNIKFDNYFTSELKRAKNTLEIILSVLEEKQNKSEDLKENNKNDKINYDEKKLNENDSSTDIVSEVRDNNGDQSKSEINLSEEKTEADE